MPYKNKEEANRKQRERYARDPEFRKKDKLRKIKFKKENPDYFAEYYQKMKTGEIKTWENAPVEDITGNRYGMLVAVSFSHREEPIGRPVWTFKCDCGETVTIASADVISGKTKACGCLSKGRKIRHDPKDSAFYVLLSAYKSAAKNRGLAFELSPEQFKALTQEICAYCGVAPFRVWTGQRNNRPPYICNGVDRIDNEQGYTAKNSVPCCSICNHAKHTMSLTEFNDWLDRIVKFRTTNPESGANSTGEK